MSHINDLREKRGKLIADARALLDKLAGSHAEDYLHLIKPEMRIRQSTAPLHPR